MTAAAAENVTVSTATTYAAADTAATTAVTAQTGS